MPTRKAIISCIAPLMLASACSDDDGQPLGRADAADVDSGAEFQCSVDCGRCPPSVADQCEAAAAICEDPNCCSTVDQAFRCDDVIVGVECDFDCSQCGDESIRSNCEASSDSCSDFGNPEDQAACCETIARLFEGPCTASEGCDIECDVACETAEDITGCRVQSTACEELGAEEQRLCCLAIAAAFPSCGEGGGGSCEFDCSECSEEAQLGCSRALEECEVLPPGLQVPCCRSVENAFARQCGGGGGTSCDVDCSVCPTPSGEANCSQAKAACDLSGGTACCDALAENLDFVCMF